MRKNVAINLAMIENFTIGLFTIGLRAANEYATTITRWKTPP